MERISFMLKFFTKLLNIYVHLSSFLRKKSFFDFTNAIWMIIIVLSAIGLIGYLKIKQLYYVSYISFIVCFTVLFASFSPYTEFWNHSTDKNTIDIIKCLSTKSYLYSMFDIIVAKLGLFIATFYIAVAQFFPILPNSFFFPFYCGFILYTIIYFTYHISRETVELDEIEMLLKLYLFVNSFVSSFLLIFDIISLKILVTFFTTTYTGLSYMLAEKRRINKNKYKKRLIYHSSFIPDSNKDN